VGGVINTFSTLAFAETTFGLLRVEKMIGPVAEMNRRSELNRAAINEWMSNSSLFELGVTKPENRGAAVTLIRVKDARDHRSGSPCAHHRALEAASLL
jgi:phosphoserine aminotransferase